MKTVLFICTHNSARSQMAESFVNHFYGDKWRVESAGTAATEVNPYAIRVMEEIGIPMEGHRSKSIEEFRGRVFDVVVTVCDNAKETCPFFPGKLLIHRGFPDPSELKGNENEVLGGFRRVRDEIREWVVRTFGNESIEDRMNEKSLNMKILKEKGGERMDGSSSEVFSVKHRRPNGSSSETSDIGNKERR